MNRIHFVTGTDTRAGKTVLTGSLLYLLRRSGVNALAMKLFCSGPRSDVRRLQRLQEGILSDDQCNPFWFASPVTPLLAARRQACRVTMKDVVTRIDALAKRCELLLVEGAGGLMSPLGEGVDAAGIIERCPCDVWIAARNRLGTLSHVLLAWNRLRTIGGRRTRLVLMDERSGDASASSNGPLLKELLGEREVFRMPYLGANPLEKRALNENAKKMEKVLATFLDSDSFCGPC